MRTALWCISAAICSLTTATDGSFSSWNARAWHESCTIPKRTFLVEEHRKGEVMSLFAWIILGLLAGFIASHLVNRRGEGMVLDVLLGIVGAVVGGWLAHLLGYAGVTALNVY